jgi:hypothetical protein
MLGFRSLWSPDKFLVLAPSRDHVFKDFATIGNELVQLLRTLAIHPHDREYVVADFEI